MAFCVCVYVCSCSHQWTLPFHFLYHIKFLLPFLSLNSYHFDVCALDSLGCKSLDALLTDEPFSNHTHWNPDDKINNDDFRFLFPFALSLSRLPQKFCSDQLHLCLVHFSCYILSFDFLSMILGMCVDVDSCWFRLIFRFSLVVYFSSF